MHHAVQGLSSAPIGAKQGIAPCGAILMGLPHVVQNVIMVETDTDDVEYGTGVSHQTDVDRDEHDAISILEYNEKAEQFGHEAGERVIYSGVTRNIHLRSEEKKDFIKVADNVATVELNQTLTDDEITGWCNTEVGKHVLAHYFDHTEIGTEVEE